MQKHLANLHIVLCRNYAIQQSIRILHKVYLPEASVVESPIIHSDVLSSMVALQTHRTLQVCTQIPL